MWSEWPRHLVSLSLLRPLFRLPSGPANHPERWDEKVVLHLARGFKVPIREHGLSTEHYQYGRGPFPPQFVQVQLQLRLHLPHQPRRPPKPHPLHVKATHLCQYYGLVQVFPDEQKYRGWVDKRGGWVAKGGRRHDHWVLYSRSQDQRETVWGDRNAQVPQECQHDGVQGEHIQSTS